MIARKLFEGGSRITLQYFNPSRNLPKLSAVLTSSRLFSNHVITPNLRLMNQGAIKLELKNNRLPTIICDEPNRPLVVLLEWMNAKEKHVSKFTDFYGSFGFDVLRIYLSPWQLMWPMKGSQIVAKDIADFLLHNTYYTPLMIHAFSVGGYLWGEVLVHIKNNQKYQPVADRICGQMFDSIVDYEEIPTGFPAAVFPNNPFIRATMEKYIRYHMKTFYNESSVHYMNSRATFAAGVVKAPSLFIYSDVDPVSTVYRNEVVRDEILALGLGAYSKCFKKSKHVSHYQKYREDYTAEMTMFLEKIKLIPEQRMQAKL